MSADIAPTVPHQGGGRGDINRYQHPTFWQNHKIESLRKFWRADELKPLLEPSKTRIPDPNIEAGVGMFGRTHAAHFQGFRNYGALSIPSSASSDSLHGGVPTERSYPTTVATSRAAEPRPPKAEKPAGSPRRIAGEGLGMIKMPGKSMLTQDKLEIVKLRTENQDLRRMCMQLEASMNHLGQTVGTLTQDAKNVMEKAQQLQAIQQGPGGPHPPQFAPMPPIFEGAADSPHFASNVVKDTFSEMTFSQQQSVREESFHQPDPQDMHWATAKSLKPNTPFSHNGREAVGEGEETAGQEMEEGVQQYVPAVPAPPSRPPSHSGSVRSAAGSVKQASQPFAIQPYGKATERQRRDRPQPVVTIHHQPMNSSAPGAALVERPHQPILSTAAVSHSMPVKPYTKPASRPETPRSRLGSPRNTSRPPTSGSVRPDLNLAKLSDAQKDASEVRSARGLGTPLPRPPTALSTASQQSRHLSRPGTSGSQTARDFAHSAPPRPAGSQTARPSSSGVRRPTIRIVEEPSEEVKAISQILVPDHKKRNQLLGSLSQRSSLGSRSTSKGVRVKIFGGNEKLRRPNEDDAWSSASPVWDAFGAKVSDRSASEAATVRADSALRSTGSHFGVDRPKGPSWDGWPAIKRQGDWEMRLGHSPVAHFSNHLTK